MRIMVAMPNRWVAKLTRPPIGNEPLVKSRFHESEMAHLLCVGAPVCLDNANVVIDRMTRHNARALATPAL